MKKFVKILLFLVTIMFAGCGNSDEVSETIEAESISEAETKVEWNVQKLKSEMRKAFTRAAEVEMAGEWTEVYEYILRGCKESILVTENRQAYIRSEDDGDLELLVENIDIPQNEDIEVVDTTSQFSLIKEGEDIVIYRYGKRINSMEYQEYEQISANGEWKFKEDTPDVEPNVYPYVFEDTEDGFRILAFTPGSWSNGEPNYAFHLVEEKCGDAYCHYYWGGKVYFIKEDAVCCIDMSTPWEYEILEPNVTCFGIADGVPVWSTAGDKLPEGKILWSK